jgi:hypothetical protein
MFANYHRASHKQDVQSSSSQQMIKLGTRLW